MGGSIRVNSAGAGIIGLPAKWKRVSKLQMIARDMTALVQARLKDDPAVGLVRPRQSGKTTRARALSRVYFDLEQPS